MKEVNSIIKKESYKTIASYITQIVSLCYAIKDEEYNEFYKNLIRISNSVILSIDICRFTYDRNNSNDKIVRDISYIINGRISSNLEKFLDSICSEEYSFFIYAWILNSYISYFPNILTLSSKDYIEIRKKVKKILPYLKNNGNYFNTFIWSKLKKTFANIETDFSLLDDTTEKNISFYINIWDKENIRNLIEEKDKKIFDYYLSIEKINKIIEHNFIILLKKLAKENIESKNKINFEEDISKYDFVKILNYHLDAINSQLSSVNNIYIQKINLLKIEFVHKNNIENFNDDYFNSLQKQVDEIIINIKRKNTNIKYVQIYFIFNLICDEEFEDKLKKKIDNIKLNIKDFTFELTIETKENLLRKY